MLDYRIEGYKPVIHVYTSSRDPAVLIVRGGSLLTVANSLSGSNAYLLVACTLIMTLKNVQYIAYSYQIWGEQMYCGYT